MDNGRLRELMHDMPPPLQTQHNSDRIQSHQTLEPSVPIAVKAYVVYLERLPGASPVRGKNASSQQPKERDGHVMLTSHHMP